MYDYEIIDRNGLKIGYKITKDKMVEIYINDKLWGIPQGDDFILPLLEKLIEKNS